MWQMYESLQNVCGKCVIVGEKNCMNFKEFVYQNKPFNSIFPLLFEVPSCCILFSALVLDK